MKNSRLWIFQKMSRCQTNQIRGYKHFILIDDMFLYNIYINVIYKKEPRRINQMLQKKNVSKYLNLKFLRLITRTNFLTCKLIKPIYELRKTSLSWKSRLCVALIKKFFMWLIAEFGLTIHMQGFEWKVFFSPVSFCYRFVFQKVRNTKN